MKKVYMPSMEELYIMQDKGVNMYKYLLVKAIESIIMDIKINQNYIIDSTSIIKNIDNRLIRENPYIEQAICTLYPEEIPYTSCAKHEPGLCLKLISEDYKQDNSIYNLDNLSYFGDGKYVFSNKTVITMALKILREKLPLMPQYRFEYKQNKLLDDIFNCELQTGCFPQDHILLATIEPAYILKNTESEFNPLLGKNAHINYYINDYAKRYGIANYECNEYENKDILTNPDADVKRLIKCIKQRTK